MYVLADEEDDELIEGRGRGRPAGAVTQYMLTIEQLDAMFNQRINIVSQGWEQGVKKSAMSYIKELDCKKRAELFLFDPWTREEQYYNRTYVLQLLQAAAPFAANTAVAILQGSQLPIMKLILHFQQPAGRKEIKSTGWESVDSLSLEIVDSGVTSTRCKGLMPNRISCMVVYMKGWTTKAHKAAYTEKCSQS